MSTDLPLRCACGVMRGVLRDVSARNGNRVVCYCDDCQAFPHFLGQADRVLDAHGGTDIYQTSPARLELSEGAENLACIRLKEGGLLRWYASCCNTPLGNTGPWPGLPFVGVILGGVACGDSFDDALGPVRSQVHARHAKGDRTSLDASDRFALGPLLRFGSVVVSARLRGDQKRSPFFDVTTGEPTVVPRVLEEAELRRAEAERDAS